MKYVDVKVFYVSGTREPVEHIELTVEKKETTKSVCKRAFSRFGIGSRPEMYTSDHIILRPNRQFRKNDMVEIIRLYGEAVTRFRRKAEFVPAEG